MSDQPHDILTMLTNKAAEMKSADHAVRPVLQRQYLELVSQHLSDVCADRDAISPMFDIIEQWDALAVPRKDRRKNFAEASGPLMAQISAVIDILISAGYSSDHACQIVARQMIAREVKVPTGGDARGWRNVQAWRHKLLASKREGEIWHIYTTFKDELLKTYGAGVAQAVARGVVWDRRRAHQPA